MKKENSGFYVWIILESYCYGEPTILDAFLSEEDAKNEEARLEDLTDSNIRRYFVDSLWVWGDGLITEHETKNRCGRKLYSTIEYHEDRHRSLEKQLATAHEDTKRLDWLLSGKRVNEVFNDHTISYSACTFGDRDEIDAAMKGKCDE